MTKMHSYWNGLSRCGVGDFSDLTTDNTHVTCKRCLKMIDKEYHPVVGDTLDYSLSHGMLEEFVAKPMFRGREDFFCNNKTTDDNPYRDPYKRNAWLFGFLESKWFSVELKTKGFVTTNDLRKEK